jgi:hypothetical protein
MGTSSQIRSFGRFLYTQNPFYLISCFLILYGLQIATIANGDIFSRSIFLTLSITAYTLLMAVTCVGVVRFGKVWQDARSIFLVVIISQVALSTALDELCISNWSTAASLLLLGATFTFLTTEFILRSCRLRFPSWYRLSFYALMTVFFVVPPLLGHAVGDRNIRLTNWGAPIFSSLVAIGLLLLIPAIRQAESLVRDNGSPWHWPLYPLTAFVILAVVACIRTHAIWMSFGFIGAPVRFEPFLLLPIALAILILVVESDAPGKATSRTFWAMGFAPAMIVCGVSRDGMTFLPIHSDLQMYFGSSLTISLAAILGFYIYLWVRAVRGSEIAVTATLLAMCGLSQLPEIADEAGLKHWMFAGAASLFTLVICLRNLSSERKWLVFTVVTTIAMLVAGHDYDRMTEFGIAAAAFASAAMLTIGALSETELARMLRNIAAVMLMIAAVGMVGWEVNDSPGMIPVAVLAGLSFVSVVYTQIVKRLGWLYVFVMHFTCLMGILGWNGYESESLSQSNWPIQTGFVCFLIGLTITSFKTGVHRRFRRHLPQQPILSRYRSGL